jgi:hypothetical protein
MDTLKQFIGIDPSFREKGFAICIIGGGEADFKIFKGFIQFACWLRLMKEGNKIFPEVQLDYKFCIENSLSFPKETSEFFKGKLGGDDLEDIRTDSIIEYIQNGVEVDLKTTGDQWGNEIRIKVSEIPSEVDLIIVKLS